MLGIVLVRSILNSKGENYINIVKSSDDFGILGDD